MGKGNKLTENECGKILVFWDQKLTKLKNWKVSEIIAYIFEQSQRLLSQEKYWRRPKRISPAMGRRILRSDKSNRGISSEKLLFENECAVSELKIRFINKN